MPEDRTGLIKSEDLFAGKEATYDQLRDFFPGLNASLADYRKQFSTRVNAKLDSQTPLDHQAEKDLLNRVDQLWQQLQKTGRFE